MKYIIPSALHFFTLFKQSKVLKTNDSFVSKQNLVGKIFPSQIRWVLSEYFSLCSPLSS